MNIKTRQFLGQISILCLFAFWTVDGRDLKVEDVVSRHLDSIGSAIKRQELKTLFAGGKSEFETVTPATRGGGRGVVVSDPENLFFLMSLNSREYPFEKIGIFKEKVALPHTSVGERSLLGKFLAEHSSILSESFFCGSMSLRWMTRLTSKALKMKYAGIRKSGDRQLHMLDVTSTGSNEFKIRLFFDEQNFRHVRSEYRREVEAGRMVFGQQNQISNAKLQLVEEFSDFREVDNLTLPYSYKVTFTSNSNNQSYESSWSILVATYVQNQKLAADFFSFDDK